jgi:uncharacterized alpha-E superfamily protein
VLSRIAESLYWIGRYVERADGTARIVDVVRLSLLETTKSDAAELVLSMIMGIEPPHKLVTFDEVRDRLVFDAGNPSSIAGSWYAARENARRAREILSTDLWEVLNTAWFRWRNLGAPDATTRHLAWTRDRAALIRGVADSSMSHDEAWDFLILGRSLERADMTARMVATGTLKFAGFSWTGVLTACNAQQAYTQTHRGVVDDGLAAAFLTLDRQFPRSVVYNLRTAEDCLMRLRPPSDRMGISDEARRRLARIRTSIEYRMTDDVIADLAPSMARVQAAVAESGAEVAKQYFPSRAATLWTGEVV